MAVSVTHAKVSAVPDSGDTDDVQMSDWNAGHVVAGAAPDDVNYLVGTATGALSGEIAVGTTPGGELGNTWASPTVDATHSGSTHAATQSAAEATAASALSTHAGASDPHTGYLKESDFTGVDFLVGTATGITASEIAVGTTPGGELGGTWASPTVDSTHSGSTHTAAVTTHEAASDPHTGYRKESDVWELVSFARAGLVTVTTESDTPPPFRFYNRSGRTLTFTTIGANATIGPSGSTMTIDVNVDGTTIMTGTKVVLPNNTGAASVVTQTTFSTTTVDDGHYVSVNVDTNGGGAVQNLLVSIWVTG